LNVRNEIINDTGVMLMHNLCKISVRLKKNDIHSRRNYYGPENKKGLPVES